MGEQLLLFELPPAYRAKEPTDPASRAALHHLRLGAAARTLDWVARQIWAEPLPLRFEAHRMGNSIAILLRYYPVGLNADCLLENDVSTSFVSSELDCAWTGLWHLIQDNKWTKTVAKHCGIKAITLHRILEDARSDEARALYELELLTQ